MRLKENLEHLLKSKDMTVASLGRLSSVPKTTISDWLAGTMPKDLKAVKRVSDVFGLSIDTMVFGDVTKPEQLEIHSDDWTGGLFEIQFRRVKR